MDASAAISVPPNCDSPEDLALFNGLRHTRADRRTGGVRPQLAWEANDSARRRAVGRRGSV